MYENMMAELKKMAAQVDALETESREAADNLEKEVQAKLSDKEKHIAEFIGQMADVMKAANFQKGCKVDVLCCGSHWEGKPNSCGSHCRSIGVCFRRTYENPSSVEVWFGRWFSGSDCIDKILLVKPDRFTPAPAMMQSTINAIARELRENVLTRWNDTTEQSVANAVFAECKKQLAKRTQAATDKLGAANDRYNQFCGGDR